MAWDKLSNPVKLAIARNQFDIERLSDLSDAQINLLNQQTSGELFDSWCNWHGFINYSNMIHNAHREIFNR